MDKIDVNRVGFFYDLNYSDGGAWDRGLFLVFDSTIIIKIGERDDLTNLIKRLELIKKEVDLIE